MQNNDILSSVLSLFIYITNLSTKIVFIITKSECYYATLIYVFFPLLHALQKQDILNQVSNFIFFLLLLCIEALSFILQTTIEMSFINK